MTPVFVITPGNVLTCIGLVFVAVVLVAIRRAR